MGVHLQKSKDKSPYSNVDLTRLIRHKESWLLDLQPFVQREDKSGVDVELQKIKQIFKIMDPDGSGSAIQTDELRRRIKLFNPKF